MVGSCKVPGALFKLNRKHSLRKDVSVSLRHTCGYLHSGSANIIILVVRWPLLHTVNNIEEHGVCMQRTRRQYHITSMFRIITLERERKQRKPTTPGIPSGNPPNCQRLPRGCFVADPWPAVQCMVTG